MGFSNMRSRLLVLALLSSFGTAGGLAQFTITDGGLSSQFNMIAGPEAPPHVNILYVSGPGNVVELYLENLTDTPLTVNSLDFTIGVTAAIGDHDTTPTILSADFLTGTPFGAVSATGSYEAITDYDAISVTISAPQGAVWPAGSTRLLATLSVDATGNDGGPWPLYWVDYIESACYISGPQGSPPYGVYARDLTDGSLELVPEPASAALLGGLGLLAFAGCRRYRK